MDETRAHQLESRPLSGYRPLSTIRRSPAGLPNAEELEFRSSATDPDDVHAHIILASSKTHSQIRFRIHLMLTHRSIARVHTVRVAHRCRVGSSVPQRRDVQAPHHASAPVHVMPNKDDP